MMEESESKFESTLEESCRMLSEAIAKLSKINDEKIRGCSSLYLTLLNGVRKFEHHFSDVLEEIESTTKAANCLIFTLKLIFEIEDENINDSIVKVKDEGKLESNNLDNDSWENDDYNNDIDNDDGENESKEGNEDILVENENIDPSKFVITDYEASCLKLHEEMEVGHSETDINSVSKDSNNFACEACPKIFISEEALKNHAIRHKVFFTGEEKYSCQICSMTFKSKIKLKCHLETHAKKKPFKCDNCPLTFAQKGNLKRHSRSHTGEKPFQCEICSKPFADKRGLTLHVENKICTKTKPMFFICKFCPKTATSKSNLKKHEATHSEIKPYQCEVCPSAFYEPSNLKLHMRTHTNEKPYNCETCSKKFAQLGQLKRHLLTHSGEKPYACDQCANAYADMKNLKFHIKYCHEEVTPDDHRPYECDNPDCQKTFKTDRDLIRHKKVHSADYVRRFQCEKCEKSFYTTSGLTEHTKVHTGPNISSTFTV